MFDWLMIQCTTLIVIIASTTFRSRQSFVLSLWRHMSLLGHKTDLNFKSVLDKVIKNTLLAWGTRHTYTQKYWSGTDLLAKVKEKRPLGWPQTLWEDYIEDLWWNRLGLQPSEMLEVVAGRDVWRLNLVSQPSRTWAGAERRRRTFISIPSLIFGVKLSIS